MVGGLSVVRKRSGGDELRLAWSRAAASFRFAQSGTAGRWAHGADVAILLGAMAVAIPQDSATADSQGKRITDYTKFLDPAGLKGARLGVVRKYSVATMRSTSSWETLLGEIQAEHGAEIIDPADIRQSVSSMRSELTVFYYELKPTFGLSGSPRLFFAKEFEGCD